jgi:hypothetical protein
LNTLLELEDICHSQQVQQNEDENEDVDNKENE